LKSPDCSTFSHGWRLKTDSFLKNEATDLLDNKGSALRRIRNEATIESQWAVGRRQ